LAGRSTWLCRIIPFPHWHSPPIEIGRSSAALLEQGPASIRTPFARCLVLLLLRVSANANMKNRAMRIYFDHNATTPVDPAAVEAITRAMADTFGNASSVHHFGQQAKALLDDARSAVAALINAEPSEIVFTSGGTESDNFALRGVAEALEPTGRRHLIASSIEHEAVLVTLRALARRGWRVTLLPVGGLGIGDTAARGE